MKYKLTRRQTDFVRAQSFEVLFGGAAGGGKSFAQVFDAVLFSYRFARSCQLILRKTIPELEKTLIRTLLENYPMQWYSYNVAKKVCTFVNGSVIEFGYCGRENDIYRYQSAEYDVIRFDELTHFPEHSYRYLISRVRGTNGYPKQLKSSTNPGGMGHEWVKQRFIDIGAPDTQHSFAGGSRIFLPARVDDNIFLIGRDPGYKTRLENLDKDERRALLLGEWDIAGGRYFEEWNRELHVVKPFEIPQHWPRYFTMDYGLDMLAGYWIATDPEGRAYVYRELYEPDHIVSSAAARILELTEEPVCCHIAPPDLWNRRQDSGRSVAETFLEYGIALTKAPAARVAGWLELKEWLRPGIDITGTAAARLVFFDTCGNAVRCIPAITRAKHNPNDCAANPHEYTHAPDALRYFVASRVAEEPPKPGSGARQNQLANLLDYGQRDN